MVRKEELQDLPREESFLRQISSSEAAVIHNMVGFLKTQRGGRLGSVNWALFLAGDFADSFDHPVVPDDIDLRLVVDAPMGSPIQKSFIEGMESTVDAYLAQKGLPYRQQTGDNWHMAKNLSDPDCHEYEKYIDSNGRHNDSRFVVDPNPAKNQREIHVIINKIGGSDIEAQMIWEKAVRQRQPIILADSRLHKFCI